VLLFLPPPALPALAAPRPSTSGRCPERLPRRLARPAGAARCLRWLGDLPLPFLLSRRPCLATRPDRAPSFCCFFPCPPLCDHQHQSAAAYLSPKILPNRTTQLQFCWPRATSPPPLAPQPNPVQPRPFPSPESSHPEPPLTGAAQARPRRRQHTPPPLPPIQVGRSFPLCPLVLVRAIAPPVRRPFAGNGDAPPRPPPFLAVGRVSPLPVEHHPSPSVS
jgi:hypothetical protein